MITLNKPRNPCMTAEAAYPMSIPPAARDVRRQSSCRNRGAGLPAPLEVLAEEDTADRAEDEPEEGPDTQEQGPDQGAQDTADGAAGGAPVACAEPPRPIGGGDEVKDKGEGGEEAKQRDGQPADVLEVRRYRVDEPRDKDQGHTREAGQDASGETDEHDDERDPEYRLAWRFQALGDDRQRLASLLAR